MWSRPKSPMSTLEKTVGLVLFTAACFFSLAAYGGYGEVCMRSEVAGSSD
jgi:hypothetical protein